MIEYGQRLRAIRIELGLNQEQMGDILGVTQGEVSRHERGERQLTQDIILTLNKKKNVNILYLIRGDLPMFEEKGSGQEVGEPAVSYGGGHQIQIPGMTGESRIWQKQSDAMAPVINAGDYVIASPADLDKLKDDKIYVIQTKDETYIRYAQRTGKNIIAINHAPNHQPRIIPAKDITGLWGVRLRLTADILPKLPIDALEERVKKIEDFLTNMILDEED